MMDSGERLLQRMLKQYDAGPTRMVDADGNNDFHRPGYRVRVDDIGRREKERARDAYEHDLTTAYRRGAGKEDVVPDVPKVSGNDAMPVDDIETAYQLYAEEISQAWKRPG